MCQGAGSSGPLLRLGPVLNSRGAAAGRSCPAVSGLRSPRSAPAATERASRTPLRPRRPPAPRCTRCSPLTRRHDEVRRAIGGRRAAGRRRHPSQCALRTAACARRARRPAPWRRRSACKTREARVPTIKRCHCNRRTGFVFGLPAGVVRLDQIVLMEAARPPSGLPRCSDLPHVLPSHPSLSLAPSSTSPSAPVQAAAHRHAAPGPGSPASRPASPPW